MSAPVRIGYCLSLTGSVAGNARSERSAHDIWREDISRQGGLLGGFAAGDLRFPI
jgi:branched-chain amino acid transport system substrate-binding protein